MPTIPLTGYQYEINAKTFLPMSLFFTEGTKDEINRLETLAFWSLSYNEILIHNAKMAMMKDNSVFKEMLEITEAYKDDIIDTFKEYLSIIINHGDFSLKQFEYYAKEHEKSRAPFGTMKWKDILDSASQLRKYWTETNLWIRKFVEDFDYLLKLEKPMIKSTFTYPALRARPAEYTIQDIQNYSIHTLARKYRDRKAGGVKGLSQLEYPIYNTDKKKNAYQPFEDLICKLLVTNRESIKFISTDGIQTYKYVIDNDDLIAYDLENAEKQVGYVLRFLPFNVDLSHPLFPSEFAPEMYSGIGPTRPTNEVTAALFLKTIKDKHDIQFSKAAFGGDNIAINADISEIQQQTVTKEERFLGWMLADKKFGPPSLVTDNPEHVRSIPNKTRGFHWIQGYQHILRPTQAIVNYDLLNKGSAVTLVEWCTENINDKEILGHDWIDSLIKEEEVLRLKFIDKFSEELEFAKQWIPYHEDPNRSTDVKLILQRTRF
jgi:hypothetical protein